MEILSRYRWVLEPLVAVVLASVWAAVVVQLGVRSLLVVVVLGAAIAVSRVSPLIALGVAWLGALAELSGVGYLPADVAWPGYLALALTIFGATAHGRETVRWLALASAVILGGASALPGVRAGFTVSRSAASLGSAATEAITITLMGAVLSIGLVVAWVLGFLVARQRSAVLRGERSLLLWLAAESGLERPAADADVASLVRPLRSWQLAVDIVLALLYLLIGAFAGASGVGIRLLVAVVFSLAIAMRRLSPAVALGLAWLAAIIHMLSGTAVQPTDLAVLIVLYATAAYGDKITRWAGLGSVGVGSLVAAAYLTLSTTLQVSYPALTPARAGSVALQFVFLLVVSLCVMGFSWVLGLLVRTGRRAAESRRALGRAESEERTARAQTVIEQQRNRIARDMHDVVAHSLAVVIAQADGARYARRTDPEAVDEALKSIASTAREALGDVRLLLGELRHNEGAGPQPTLADLDRLIEQLAAAGLQVDRDDEGEPRSIGTAAQLALYRIAQEALTNALRHGRPGGRVEFALTWTETGVLVRSRNDFDADSEPGPREPDTIGHGISGMRERALLVGGTLRIEAEGGRFVVDAFVPTGPRIRAAGLTTNGAS